MPFEKFMTDTVDLLKSDGSKKTGLKASVQKNKVFMNANDVLVEPQDLIIRRMSNGAEETYRVIDPRFHEHFHGIKAHYQMKVHKLGYPETKNALQSITYNITGNNARINQNSVDNSNNIVRVDERAIQYMEALRKEIDGSTLSAPEKAEATEVVDEIERACRSDKPKKSVVNALLKALPHFENVGAIVSDLAGLLNGCA